MTPARMRTIDGALEQLRQDDPGCCLTRHALRRMVLEGKVPHVMAGAKYLVNYDGLLAVLAGENKSAEPESKYSMIRKVI